MSNISIFSRSENVSYVWLFLCLDPSSVFVADAIVQIMDTTWIAIIAFVGVNDDASLQV